MRKWNFKHPDIVSILTFAAYSGSVKDNEEIRFSGKVLNRIKPILSKYFKNIKTHTFHYKYPNHMSMRLNICATEFLRQAVKKGWSFKKTGSDGGIPDYVFQDADLFRHFLSVVMDCNAHLYFKNHNARNVIVLQMRGACSQRWEKFRFYLNSYNLPFGHLTNGKNGCQLGWFGKDVYTLLDFIGWDLQRPRNVSIMKYLGEKQEVMILGKHIFM